MLRHAKSAWPEGVPDHDRPLNPRGRRDAPAAGAWLHDAGCVPDLVLCSTARRTRQTWELAEPRLAGADPRVVFDARLYGATAAQVLAVVRDVPRQWRSVLVIGHHPGVQDLVLLLADEAVERDAQAQARTKFPTSAVAVLALHNTWAELSPAGAVLTHFAVPRGLKH